MNKVELGLTALAIPFVLASCSDKPRVISEIYDTRGNAQSEFVTREVDAALKKIEEYCPEARRRVNTRMDIKWGDVAHEHEVHTTHTCKKGLVVRVADFNSDVGKR